MAYTSFEILTKCNTPLLHYKNIKIPEPRSLWTQRPSKGLLCWTGDTVTTIEIRKSGIQIPDTKVLNIELQQIIVSITYPDD